MRASCRFKNLLQSSCELMPDAWLSCWQALFYTILANFCLQRNFRTIIVRSLMSQSRPKYRDPFPSCLVFIILLTRRSRRIGLKRAYHGDVKESKSVSASTYTGRVVTSNVLSDVLLETVSFILK